MFFFISKVSFCVRKLILYFHSCRCLELQSTMAGLFVILYFVFINTLNHGQPYYPPATPPASSYYPPPSNSRTGGKETIDAHKETERGNESSRVLLSTEL